MVDRFELLHKHLAMTQAVEKLNDAIPTVIQENPDLEPDIRGLLEMSTLAINELVQLTNIMQVRLMQQEDIIETLEAQIKE